MIKYPSILPFPLLNSTSFKQQSNILRTEMNSGRARQRRRFLSVPTMMTASWRLSNRMAVILEGFYEHGLKENEWFLMDIPTPKGMVQHEVRFVNSPMEDFKPLGSEKWAYQAKIEIKKREVPTEKLTVEYLLEPSNLQHFIQGIANAINNYQEE